MDVTNEHQAQIAQNSGACAVMALERVPADIRAQGIFLIVCIYYHYALKAESLGCQIPK